MILEALKEDAGCGLGLGVQKPKRNFCEGPPKLVADVKWDCLGRPQFGHDF
jgi:hypothetical protein